MAQLIRVVTAVWDGAVPALVRGESVVEHLVLWMPGCFGPRLSVVQPPRLAALGCFGLQLPRALTDELPGSSRVAEVRHVDW